MSTVMVNHNYPNDDEMTVVDEQDIPIEGVEIRIFELTAFQAGVVDSWVGSTLTDIDGHWIDPIGLESGNTWVVHFEKPTVYGPEHVEITT